MASAALIDTIQRAPHTFLQPSPDTPANAISFTKSILDTLAEDVVRTQAQRRDENRRKRKRGADEPVGEVLQLRSLYTNNLAVKQVWEQARRILDAACSEVEAYLPEQPQEHAGPDSADEDASDIYENAEVLGEEDAIESGADITDDEEMGSDIDDEEIGLENGIEEEEDIEMSDAEEDALNGDLSDDVNEQSEVYAPDKHGLNDGFFSIDDFNRQSQFLEQMDARGEDDNPSDEDDVDWDADPLLQQPTAMGPHKRKDDDESDPESDDGDEEDGPTFGNADLNAPDTDEEEDEDIDEADLDNAMPGLTNTNEINYADFFEPPPKKLSKTKRMRALPKTQPQDNPSRPQAGDDDIEAEMQRAMADVNRDIFASESENESANDSDAASDTNTRNMSTHEKQRAKIASEIRHLEAASVAKRDWALSGEASSASRPLNSLIEEDLVFERVGKPVPVVTAETSEEIETLIKRRILAREFDEVVRRHPDSIGGASETRRGRIELDDSKAQTGLADVYAQEHLKATDPNYVDTRSKQTKKAHAEIEKLWREVSNQLDLLSNLHFKPKRAEAEVTVIEDKPRIAMEDARPDGGEGTLGEETTLAPQEVYKAGDRKVKGEVMRAGGAAVSKEEMSREERRRKRRREKERGRKGRIGQGVEPVKKVVDEEARGGKAKKLGKKKKEEKQGILEDLKRGNVQVVGKKGELQDLSGKKGRSEVTSSALKL
ncbi:U3 small nucleolar RNA-associated protein MPP10 [Cyphellophora attinorum]|uniref:U3 small nucleolar ribonucleoprotein protein MPP10 n=1 Tax=Cyphellophora attinorum TaxID=1664694 RepID=A0A0N1HG73_9EURO|nr:U3 small nucleolar RNA-associated protein MPP10 [Phialophora attinorum]KPI44524.1 U3 small nucleolar RNA-associated protein MPP10 [Phialophora attinorum]